MEDIDEDMEELASHEDTSQSDETEFERKLQRTLFVNKYLPYYSALTAEAEEMFMEIKENLSLAVQRHELWPGATFWTHRLQSFLKMHSFHFTKEDHIKLIQLVFQLVITPDIESAFLLNWANLLTQLLKKPKTLPPSDLTLPWRPLYDVAFRVFKCKFLQHGMKIYSVNTGDAIKRLVLAAKIYFPVESTQEMLEEWRPLLCVYDMSMVDGVSFMSYFLPTLMAPDQHHRGYKLWFEEFMKLYLDLSNSAEEYFNKLFVRLAVHTMGFIDWSPYLPQIFSRILKSFQLPIGPSQLRIGHQKQYLEANMSATWIVSMLGGGSPTQDHLNRLMLSLESYYHPSNHSRMTRKLLSFLKELSGKFILRLKEEQSKKKSWIHSYITTEEAKLTDKDIDDFVQCLLPSLRMAIFSKFGTVDAAVTLHSVALIRPEMILPDLLDKTYTALETLTEPHQVIATLQCMTAVSRSLLNGGHGRYPEGKKHLFSLLTHALPGIDPNDYRKTLVSGLLISALVAMVPLVDCGTSINNSSFNMTEEEKELCSLTMQFEDFLLVFLDRCFALVGNARLEQAGAMDRQVSLAAGNTHESIMGAGMSGSVHTILVQASPQLFKVASEKIFRYATSQVFESEIAGRLCADMCGSVSKANPEAGLKLFVPHCVREINHILEDSYQMDAEHPDHALIWNLQMLAQVLHKVGSTILPYADQLLPCLQKCVHLKSKQAFAHASAAVANILQSLTLMYPMDSCSIGGGFSKSPEEHLYIRDWSIPMDKDNVDVSWHIPSLEDLQLVDRVLDEFLRPEIERLRSFMAGEGEEWDREELNQTLKLLNLLVFGACRYFSMWEGPQVAGCPKSCVNLQRKPYVTFELAKSAPEMFTREKLAHFVHDLTDHIMRAREDDTKSMLILVQLIRILLGCWGVSGIELDAKWHAFKYSRKVIGDQLRGRSSQVRPLFIMRLYLQHEYRLTARYLSTQTDLHHLLFRDLLKMSVSHYAHVRVKAQGALNKLLDMYLYSGRKLLPHVLPHLNKDDNISHEQFKGALHVLQIPVMVGTFTHDWSMLRKVLPIIIKAGHSEKPSIQALMTKLSQDIKNRYEYFSLKFTVSDGAMEAAAALYGQEDEAASREGSQRCSGLAQESIKDYEALVDEVVDLIEQEKLQWRYLQIAIHFLVMLIRHDHPLPISGIRLIVRSLVHDLLLIRKMAISAVIYLLQQQKRRCKKIPVDVPKEAGVDTVSADLPAGEKKENSWLCYNPDRLPSSEEEWESFTFIDKTHWGYYTYPRELMTYAPYKDQPSLSRSAAELSEAERVIYDSFSSPEFVEKLVSFFSLEENKGKDRYNVRKFILFKYLFRNFGTTFLPLFKPHIEKLSVDIQQDSHQRFSAEFISGLVSGSKHWNYAMVQEMREFLEPLFIKIMDAITPETLSDWSTCMSEISANRDPRRLFWLLELFIKDPLSGQNGTFKDAGRLYLLQSLMAQQEWRVGVLLHQIVDYLREHLDHSYKMVRERIGSFLSQIFLYDKPAPTDVKFNPSKMPLIEEVLQKMPTLEQVVSLTEDESTLKLCKTCLVWMVTSFQYGSDVFKLIPELLPLVTVENDDSVTKLVKTVCARVAHTSLPDEVIPVAIAALEKSMKCVLWKVRVIAIQVLQVLLFENLFLCVPFRDSVTSLLVALCEDPQMEAREIAAASISGLVRCGYINSIHKLKSHFVKQSHCKLPKKMKMADGGTTAQEKDGSYEGALMRRHAGVLGLAALVEACPYSVPDWLPDILDEFALHLHDPTPIEGTVKKTMSEFKRTHYDSWSEHKQKFTDDQLGVLADLLISPSYYA